MNRICYDPWQLVRISSGLSNDNKNISRPDRGVSHWNVWSIFEYLRKAAGWGLQIQYISSIWKFKWFAGDVLHYRYRCGALCNHVKWPPKLTNCTSVFIKMHVCFGRAIGKCDISLQQPWPSSVISNRKKPTNDGDPYILLNWLYWKAQTSDVGVCEVQRLSETLNLIQYHPYGKILYWYT